MVTTAQWQKKMYWDKSFFIDLVLYVDLKQAGDSDNVVDTVHYGEAYELVKDIVENKRFNLIEKLAQTIALRY